MPERCPVLSPHTTLSPCYISLVSDSLLDDAIDAARDAANAAFAAAVAEAEGDEAPEIRLMLCATAGDPSTGYSRSEVRFAAPGGVAISHHDKVAMALSSMKAVAPDLYGTMVAGLERGRRTIFAGVWARVRSASR
jgi:hypothetical protein